MCIASSTPRTRLSSRCTTRPKAMKTGVLDPRFFVHIEEKTPMSASEETRRNDPAVLPKNHFKHAIAQGRQQIGLWCSVPSAFTAEILAPAGFDWLLFDTEHSPSSVPTVLSQLQAAAPYG